MPEISKYVGRLKFHDIGTDEVWFQGEVENGLLALQQKEGSNLEVSIIRPGGVLAKATAVPDLLVGATMSIKVDELASAMIDEAVTNEKGTRTFECAALRNRGRALLKERK
jgi:hypothetical protein